MLGLASHTLGLAALPPVLAAARGETALDRSGRAATTVEVTVRAAAGSGQIVRGQAGLSYEKAKLGTPFFAVGNATLVGLFRGVGPSLLRLGGNSVDECVFVPRHAFQGDGNSAGAPLPTPGVITPSDLERLRGFLDATGWQVLYGINLGQNTAARAAEEARAAARILGEHLVAFELGNEPDLFSANGLRAPTYGFADYLAEWQAMQTAIRLAVPKALFSGPASSYDLHGFSLPLAKALGRGLALLSQHYYRADGEDATSTLELLLSPDPGLPGALTSLASAVSDAGTALGFRYTEANSFYHGGRPGVSNSFGAALWAIDFLFETARGGASGVNFHGGGHTAGYTPIADDDLVALGPRPEYYAMRFVKEVGLGRLAQTEIEAGRHNLAAYAVHGAAESLSVVLLNKEPWLPARASLSFEQNVSGAELLSFGAASLGEHEKILLAGAALGNDGSWNPPRLRSVSSDAPCHLEIDLAPASALLVRTL
jgi:hypothetical protein